MKNLQIVLADALYSYEWENIEKSISKEINDTLLLILVNNEPFDKIDAFIYSRKDPTKILKSSIHYIIALLERAKYRVEKYQQSGKTPLHICLYVIEKIDEFIDHLDKKL